MRRWSAGIVACTFAVPLLLAGCAEKQQASESLPTASRTTAAKTLPPLGPADFPVPADARRRTTDGVIAFTEYYVQLLNHQLVSLDSAPIRDLSRSCQTCTELADSYDKIKAAGYRYAGGELTLTGTGSAVITDRGGEASLLLEQAPISVRDASGNEVPGRTHPSTKFTGGVLLTWDLRRTTWLMTQFDADPL